MRVDREALLEALEAVRPGLSKREVVEQSDCVVIQEGVAYTYNDEVCCRAPVPLDPSLRGAFPAEKLLAWLSSLTHDTVEVEDTGKGVLISVKGRKAEIYRKAEIVLPFASVPVPDSWNDLPEHFGEAVDTAKRVASRDDSKFLLTCVHVTPEHLEGCDNYQVVRWTLPTGYSRPTLYKGWALGSVAERGLTHFSESDIWTHFQDARGRQYSVRCYLDEYPDLEPALANRGGETIHLPKELGEIIKDAERFAEGEQVKKVRVTLKPGKVLVRGEGTAGWVEGSRKVSYAGGTISFLVPPKILLDILDRHSDCQLVPGFLRAEVGSYVYLGCLSAVPEEPRS